ncbi:MAG: nucleotide exchange factor GrpE [Trueperaceae bacterium]
MSETTDHKQEERREARENREDAEGVLTGDHGESDDGESDDGESDDGESDDGVFQTDESPGAAESGGSAQETEILRNELMRLQEELNEALARADELKDRFVRARAELDNFRKRAAADAERARESGLDSAVLPVLSVYDDLRRAIDAADTTDPAQIVPGVQSVLSTLERNLDGLGIKTVGSVGDPFDPDLHEALTSIPTTETAKPDTIAEVFQLGFQKGERLIRPARVVVYQS